MPTAPEVALLKDINPPAGSHRSMVCSVHQRCLTNNDRAELSFFKDYHRSYIPLQYVLLFLHGTDGWTLGTKSLSVHPQEVTIVAWVRFHMMTGPTHYNILHGAQKLYQQYITDEFERYQCMEMQWFRNNQKILHADKYKGLVYSAKNDTVEGSGKLVILPATYACSDRWYHIKYKNTMSIVRTRGKHHFLLL